MANDVRESVMIAQSDKKFVEFCRIRPCHQLSILTMGNALYRFLDKTNSLNDWRY